MSDDLIERLTAPIWASLPVEYHDLVADAAEAADKIKRLESEVTAIGRQLADMDVLFRERAEAAEAALKMANKSYVQLEEKVCAQMEIAEAEVARLREVLAENLKTLQAVAAKLPFKDRFQNVAVRVDASMLSTRQALKEQSDG